MTLLKKIWHRDKFIAIIISVMVVGYILLHFIGLELYPFQLFPMYSQKVYKQDKYTAYTIVADAQPYNFDTLAHRPYTYLMNTIERYDQIVSDGEVKEVEVIRKFFSTIGMEQSVCEKKLIDSYHVDAPEIQMQAWMKQFLLEDKVYEIYRLEGHYVNGRPIVQDTVIILSGL